MINRHRRTRPRGLHWHQEPTLFLKNAGILSASNPPAKNNLCKSSETLKTYGHIRDHSLEMIKRLG